jgi:hypothetical protein
MTTQPLLQQMNVFSVQNSCSHYRPLFMSFNWRYVDVFVQCMPWNSFKWMSETHDLEQGMARLNNEDNASGKRNCAIHDLQQGMARLNNEDNASGRRNSIPQPRSIRNFYRHKTLHLSVKAVLQTCPSKIGILDTVSLNLEFESLTLLYLSTHSSKFGVLNHSDIWNSTSILTNQARYHFAYYCAVRYVSILETNSCSLMCFILVLCELYNNLGHLGSDNLKGVRQGAKAIKLRVVLVL